MWDRRVRRQRAEQMGLSDRIRLIGHVPEEALPAREADIVLPATMFLEHDDIYQASGHSRFQIGRNRLLYAESLPGVDLLHGDGRFAIAAAAELYQGILEDIEANDYQVFSRRAYLTGWEKLRRLPSIWGRARTGYGKDSK